VRARLPLGGRSWLRLLPLVFAAAALVLGVAAADATPARSPAIGTARAATAAGTTCGASFNAYAVSLRPPPGPPQVTARSFMATIQKRGYLTAGVDQNTYPFGFLNPSNDQIQGFDIDMVDAVAHALRVKPRYIPISDAQRKPDLENGSVDIVAHTMSIQCDRLTYADFSSVYFVAHQRVLVLKNSKVHSLADLRGQRVCATSTSDSVARIVAAGAIPDIVTYWSDCLVLLQQGQVAAISTDNAILAGLAKQDPWTTQVGPWLSNEIYGLAISKQHTDFVRFVNAVLEQLRTDGQWSASYAHWIGGTVPAPPPALYRN
jgi:polar amino acid transport system substrate-binding protein